MVLIEAVTAEIGAGAILERLWEMVRDVATQPGRLREQCQRFERYLANLKPILEKLSPAELKDEALVCELRKGEELISKCAHVSRWNFLKQKKYSRRLKKLQEEIDRLVNILTLKILASKKNEVGGIRRFFRCFACSSPSDPAERDRGEHS